MIDNSKAYGSFMQISNSNLFNGLEYKIDEYTGETIGLLVNNVTVNTRMITDKFKLENDYMTFLIYVKALGMLDGGPEMLDIINSKIDDPNKMIKESDIIVNNLIRIFPNFDFDKETKMDILSLCQPVSDNPYIQVIDFSYRLQRNILRLFNEGVDEEEIHQYATDYTRKASNIKSISKLIKSLKKDQREFRISTDTSHIDEHIEKYNKDEISKKEFLDRIFNARRGKKKNVTNNKR